jgi:hypothetical protein
MGIGYRDQRIAFPLRYQYRVRGLIGEANAKENLWQQSHKERQRPRATISEI